MCECLHYPVTARKELGPHHRSSKVIILRYDPVAPFVDLFVIETEVLLFALGRTLRNTAFWSSCTPCCISCCTPCCIPHCTRCTLWRVWKRRKRRIRARRKGRIRTRKLTTQCRTWEAVRGALSMRSWLNDLLFGRGPDDWRLYGLLLRSLWNPCP